MTNQTASAGTNQIVAYAADANGQLTAVPGSPFNQNVYSLAAHGTYLLASSNSGPDINSYTIGSNGALTLGPQFNYSQDTGYLSSTNSGCGGVGGLLFDQSGQTLYGDVDNISCSNNNAIASFTFNSSNGSLSYLGNVNIGYDSSADISFLGNNAYAYSALYDACMFGGLSSFARGVSGLLTGFIAAVTPSRGPAAPPGATSAGVASPGYWDGRTAGDTTNHVVIAEFPCFEQSGVVVTQVQLATYTADANGALSTTDTYATMPATTAITDSFGDMKISPSGTLLAVAGRQGLQVFHFNGAKPITSFTSLLATGDISQVSWDNDNHLYAITGNPQIGGANPGKLYVFTVTDTSASASPGSPYTITTPLALAVQSE
ncbi:MAG: hypothetical protein WA802_07980 [Terracidiphilus sp.]